jgi:hypothetical protein
MRLARALKVAAVGVAVFAMTALALPLSASAVAPSWVEPPARVYMLPTNNASSAPAGFPSPIEQTELLFDGGTDAISGQVRTLEVESAEVSCDPDEANDFDWAGCTAIQMDVNNGVLDFTETPNVVNDPELGHDVLILPGGAILREIQALADLPAPVVNIIGTTAQVNDALATLRYTPAADYYYRTSDTERLHLTLVQGTDSTAINWDVDIKVQDYNDAPTLTVPAGVTDVASDAQVQVGLPVDWAVTDEDNDETVDGEDPPGSGIDPDDGAGRKFLTVGWATCGQFAWQGISGFDPDNSISDLITQEFAADPSNPTAEELVVISGVLAQLPAEIFGHDFTDENANEFHTAFAALAADIEEVNYGLDLVQFWAHDEASDTPVSNETCRIKTFVADLGNNGLPKSYDGAPPTGLEVPFVQFDQVKEATVKVGAGTELELSLTGAPSVTEGTTGSVTLNISPADHPAFTVSVGSGVGFGAVAGLDYTAFFTPFNIPADASSIEIPVDALDDLDIDPNEYYYVELAPVVAPAGYTTNVVDGLEQVSILDTDGIDITPPTATVGQAPFQADPSPFSPIVFVVAFSEAVTGFGNEDSDVSFVGSTAGGTLTKVVTSNGDGTYNVAVSGMTTAGTVVISVPAGAAEDASSNPSDAAVIVDNSVTWVEPDLSDSIDPTVTINQAGGQSDPANVEPILFTIVFSEPVFGLTGGGITLNGTASPNLVDVSGNGSVYTAEVTAMTNAGTVIATVTGGAAVDQAGNPSMPSTSTDNQVTWLAPDPTDLTPPTVTVEQALTQGDPTSTSPIVFDVLFSEQVMGFDGTDVFLAGAAAPGAVATVSGGGPAYTISVSGMTIGGTLQASIPAGMVTDANNNQNLVSGGVDNMVDYQLPVDVTPPDVTINQAASQSDPTPFVPVAFDVVFTEPVISFDPSKVIVGGTALPLGSNVSGSGTTWLVQVGGMTVSGTVTASLAPAAATDMTGNPSTASTSTDNVVTWTVPNPGDVTKPTVTIDQGATQVSPTSLSPIVFDVLFSEPITGFTGADVFFAGSTAGGTLVASVSGAGPAYTVSVSGMTTDGTVTATIPLDRVLDGNSNSNFASTSSDNTVSWTSAPDIVVPTVTIDEGALQADPTSTSPIVFDVVFSESVTGFDGADVTLGGTAGATTATVSGPGPAYTVSVTGMIANGTVLATIGAGVVVDGGGNGNDASTSADNSVTWVVDTTAPTVTVEQGGAQADPTSASPITFDVVFSEPIAGLADSDFDLSGSTAGGTLVPVISGSGTAYTVTVTGMTTAGDVILTLPVGAVVDGGNNPNAASTSTDNIVEWAPIVAPLLVIVPPDVSVIAAQGQSGAIVTFATPTASGGVPPVNVVCDHVSGEFFPIGTTEVTCTATDSAPIQVFAVTSASFFVVVTAAPVTSMPVTGAEAAPLVSLALLLMAAGGLVLLLVRRRQTV